MKLCLILAVAGFAFGQTSFEVVSIKLAAAAVPFERDGRIETGPQTVTMRDVTAGSCIQWAWDLQPSQVVGPDRMTAARYDIVAKSTAPASVAELKLMARAMLAERFRLAFHLETKEMPVYLLEVMKNAPKVRRATPDTEGGIENGVAGLTGRSATMRQLGNTLSGAIQRPILDKTNLPGRYDFAMDFTAYLPQLAPDQRHDAASVILATLQGELGLTLKSERAAVAVLIVDAIETATPN